MPAVKVVCHLTQIQMNAVNIMPFDLYFHGVTYSMKHSDLRHFSFWGGESINELIDPCSSHSPWSDILYEIKNKQLHLLTLQLLVFGQNPL